MISYLGSLIQFIPATGRAGHCRQISLCGEYSPCSGHTGFALYRGVCAFPIYTAQAPGCSIWSGPCVECGSSFRVLHKSVDLVSPVCCVFPGLSSSGIQRLAPLSPGAVRLFPLRQAAWAARNLHAPSLGAAPFPSSASSPGSQRLARPLPGHGAPFPSAAPAHAAGQVSGSF